MILDRLTAPADLRGLTHAELEQLAGEIRDFIVETVTATGGHLGSNLGAVELTLAIHRVFDSPRDIVLWDTGHQAYVHKLVTGRKAEFDRLRQEGGLSGYPNREESDHDWIENSHASTVLSYAHGLATSLALGATPSQGAGREDGKPRRVVAVVGDGALTGGMAYEALNNLGHSERRVVIVLNDNGRSYAPTVSKLSESVTRLRLNPSYLHAKARMGRALRDIPALGTLAMSGWSGLRAAVREVVEPPVFFESLGVRYTGPIDGHDIAGMEHALAMAAEYEGPIVVHVLTQKGRGYAPAEDDEIQCLHDFKLPVRTDALNGDAPLTYGDAFTLAVLQAARRDPRVVAITAAMPGPTGLLPFQAEFPERFVDVGIAEQHAVTAAAGMAMGGLRPIVALYSTFFTRAFDQAIFDVGLHKLPVVFILDRAGITGEDGASHHGVLDLALTLKIPGMTVFAPSSAQEVPVMLDEALGLSGPSVIRWPKNAARQVAPAEVGRGLRAHRLRRGTDVCILAVGKMVEAALGAANELATEGVQATVWDVRVVSPLDQEMISDAASFGLVVTVEDGMRVGGAGSHMADAIANLDPGRASPPVLMLGTPIEYIPHAKPASILARFGLDGPGVAESIRQALAGARAHQLDSEVTRVD
jgi:1-deoxy-D-xylulose-5-phosphate synthase